jgi:hypothetical protein
LSQHLFDLAAQERCVEPKGIGTGKQQTLIVIRSTDPIPVSTQQVFERALAAGSGRIRIREDSTAEGMFGEHPLDRRNESPEPMSWEGADAAVADRAATLVIRQADGKKLPSRCACRVTSGEPSGCNDEIARFQPPATPLCFQEPGSLHRPEHQMGRRRARPVEGAADLADPNHSDTPAAKGPGSGIGEGQEPVAAARRDANSSIRLGNSHAVNMAQIRMRLGS